MKSEIKTSVKTSSTNFLALCGDGYTVFGEALNTSDGKLMGPKQFQIKTALLPEFIELAKQAEADWKRAKEIEQKEIEQKENSNALAS